MARGRTSVKKPKRTAKSKAASKIGKLTAELGAVKELLAAARKLKKPSKKVKFAKKKVDSRKKSTKSNFKKVAAAKKAYRTKWIKKNMPMARYDTYKSAGVLPEYVPTLDDDEMEEAVAIADEIEAGKRPFSSQDSSFVTPEKKRVM